MSEICTKIDSYRDLVGLALVLVIFFFGQYSFLIPIYIFRDQTLRKIWIPESDKSLPLIDCEVTTGEVKNSEPTPSELENLDETTTEDTSSLIGPQAKLDEKCLLCERELLQSRMILKLFERDSQHHNKILRLEICQAEVCIQIPRYVMLVQLFGAILVVFGWMVALANDNILIAFRKYGFSDIVTGNFMAVLYLFQIGLGLNQMVFGLRKFYLPTFDHCQMIFHRLFYWGSAVAIISFMIIHYPYLLLYLFDALVMVLLFAFAICCFGTLFAFIPSTERHGQRTQLSPFLRGLSVGSKRGLALPPNYYEQPTWKNVCQLVLLTTSMATMFILATAMTGGPVSKYSQEICLPYHRLYAMVSFAVGAITSLGITVSFLTLRSAIIVSKPVTIDYSKREYTCSVPDCSDTVIIPDPEICIFCCRNGHIVTCAEAFPNISQSV
jgi:hypothetical protein